MTASGNQSGRLLKILAAIALATAVLGAGASLGCSRAVPASQPTKNQPATSASAEPAKAAMVTLLEKDFKVENVEAIDKQTFEAAKPNSIQLSESPVPDQLDPQNGPFYFMVRISSNNAPLPSPENAVAVWRENSSSSWTAR